MEEHCRVARHSIIVAIAVAMRILLATESGFACGEVGTRRHAARVVLVYPAVYCKVLVAWRADKRVTMEQFDATLILLHRTATGSCASCAVTCVLVLTLKRIAAIIVRSSVVMNARRVPASYAMLLLNATILQL